MGVLTNVFNFTTSKRGKLVTLSVVGAGIVVFIVGLLLILINPKVIPATKIELVAANMPYTTVAGYPGYHLEVNRPTTTITVKSTPLNSTDIVTFTTASPFIESITDKVPAGGTAILKLKRVPVDGIGLENYYKLSDPDPLVQPNEIRIDVTCGQHQTFIYVRIIIKPEDVRVTANLEMSMQGTWVNTDSLDMSHLYSMNLPIDPPEYYYRVRIKLFIFDELIYDSAEIGFNNFRYTDYLDYVNSGSGIFLFGENKQEINRPIDPPPNADGIYFFKISAMFDGVEYFADTDFELVVIA